MNKIQRLEYWHIEKTQGKRITIKSEDCPEEVKIPENDELVNYVKRNGELCEIDKINEIIDFINLPWYKKLFTKLR